MTIAMKSTCGGVLPFKDEWKVANHADEKPCVNLAAFGEDLRGLIKSQGYIGSSPFKRVSYQTCGRRTHMCHSDFNLGPSSCHYVAIQIFFLASGLSVRASFTVVCCRQVDTQLARTFLLFSRVPAQLDTLQKKKVWAQKSSFIYREKKLK